MYRSDENSTQISRKTPFGFRTPFKFPTKQANDTSIVNLDLLGNLSRQLYPTGRAWWMVKNSNFDLVHKSINQSLLRVVNNSASILDSNIPDNKNFTINDVVLWEYRLGLSINSKIPIEDRKLAIKRKLAYTANVPARQSRSFIEYQLRAAGFDVYVHENIFFDAFGGIYYKTPKDVFEGVDQRETQHGGPTQHGGSTQHGFSGFALIANEANETPESYSIGDGNLWATFFIGAKILGETAIVDEKRIIEFKELVLKLKPAHTVAFTFINYAPIGA